MGIAAYCWREQTIGIDQSTVSTGDVEEDYEEEVEEGDGEFSEDVNERCSAAAMIAVEETVERSRRASLPDICTPSTNRLLPPLAARVAMMCPAALAVVSSPPACSPTSSASDRRVSNPLSKSTNNASMQFTNSGCRSVTFSDLVEILHSGSSGMVAPPRRTHCERIDVDENAVLSCVPDCATFGLDSTQRCAFGDDASDSTRDDDEDFYDEHSRGGRPGSRSTSTMSELSEPDDEPWVEKVRLDQHCVDSVQEALPPQFRRHVAARIRSPSLSLSARSNCTTEWYSERTVECVATSA